MSVNGLRHVMAMNMHGAVIVTVTVAMTMSVSHITPKMSRLGCEHFANADSSARFEVRHKLSGNALRVIEMMVRPDALSFH